MKKEILNQLSTPQKFYQKYSEILDSYENSYKKLWPQIKKEIDKILSDKNSFKDSYADEVDKNFQFYNTFVNFSLDGGTCTESPSLLHGMIEWIYIEDKGDAKSLSWALCDARGSLNHQSLIDLKILLKTGMALYELSYQIGELDFEIQDDVDFLPHRKTLNRTDRQEKGITAEDWIKVLT